MTLKNIACAIAVTAVSSMSAQDFTFKNYSWSEQASIADVPEKYKSENEVILERHIKKEILSHNGEPQQYYLYHEKTFINSDDAVER
ncbi:MAG: hypothetical protein EOO01_27620, partial [Chitinophagaceae bacterium]